MARTKQTARKSTGKEGTVIDNPELDEKEAEKLKEIEEGSMRAELKHIDKKFTEQGQTYYAETVDEDIPEQVNWWSKFALCLVRTMAGDHKNPHVQKTSLQINSQHLKDILKATVEKYPGVSFATKDITIDKPYHVLYHYRAEIEDAGTKFEADSEASQHLNLLLEFIEDEFEDQIEEAENLLDQGLVTYENMWTIFRPGTIVAGAVHGQPRAFKLNSYQYNFDPAALFLNVEYIDFDGERMGTRTTSRLLGEFTGSEKIEEMYTLPLEWHKHKAIIVEKLIERGRRWEQHAGMHFRTYKGIALDTTSCPIERYSVEGRIVVDTKTHHRLNANNAFSLTPFKAASDGKGKSRIQDRLYDDDDDEISETLDLVPEQKLDLVKLTADQCMLTSAMVRGFSFSEKKWLDFFIDDISPVDWNPNCFNELVLPDAQKDLVKALVATHVQQRLQFDDIVKGKGKGLIFVLHGSPGVGKTLTAETVAEYCKRPLYNISSGDLGIESKKLDERLGRILDMASTWKAVLLIDEADIFLERRSLHDLERNSLVSIFLRVLEYYEGILFLTSNRVNTFDDAFKSRIHVPLKYNELTVSSRKTIWKNFLGKLEGEKVDIDDQGCDTLALADINGRQIKNVIRTAKSLAQHHGEPLDQKKLEQVIQIQMEFEQMLDVTYDRDGSLFH